MAIKEEFIKTYTGQIIGVIRTAANGDKIAYSYPGRRILGYYRVKQDITTDLVGRVLSRGDSLASLFYNNTSK